MARSDQEQRAYDDGVLAERLDGIDRHFATINGSIEKFAISNSELASEIRTVQEQLRLAAERVTVAAKTLADETERRRAALETETGTADRRWTKRQQLAALLIALIAALAAVYLATH